MGSVEVSDGGGEVRVGAIVGRGKGVFVEIALCVSVSATTAVLAVEMAVSILSASLTVGAAGGLPQAASRTAARDMKINGLPKMFIVHFPFRKSSSNVSFALPELPGYSIKVVTCNVSPSRESV
jgi:hypothetical protein